jgi:chromosome segregation protein
MTLSTVQMFGFKSFADPIQLELSRRKTGIVGPGGCGKLALLEGIRWALGESSPGALRVHTAQELIFAGSHRRRPMTNARVSRTVSMRLVPGPHLRSGAAPPHD